MSMIQLTSPEGLVYIRKAAVVAVSETLKAGRGNTMIRSLVWLEGRRDAFNILEDAPTVHGLLTGDSNSSQKL